MGFMDFLSGGLTGASTAVGAYQQGAQEKEKRGQEDVLKLIALRRQQSQDADNSAMHAAQMANMQSQVDLRKQTALRNRRAHEALLSAGQAVGEYNDAEDYVSPLATFQKDKIDKEKSARANNLARRNVTTLYPKDERVMKLLETDDPDNPNDWTKIWADIQEGERQKAVDARAEAGRAASDERLNKTIAAGMAGRQFTVDNRVQPGEAKRMDRATKLADFESTLNQYEKLIDDMGTEVRPWAASSGSLGNVYQHIINTSKELAGMGALQLHEQIAIQRALTDPTSLRERVLSGGTDKKHAAKIKAQLAQARQTLADAKKNVVEMGGYLPQTKGGGTLAPSESTPTTTPRPGGGGSRAAAWIAINPRRAGETEEAYKARYRAAVGK